MDDTERQAWIAGLKERYGIRCIGDEPRAAEAPDWPAFVGQARAWQAMSLGPAMVSLDGRHFYEVPDGMGTGEFLDSLPLRRCLPGCNRADGHDGRDEGACMRDGAVLEPGASFQFCRVYWGSHGCDLERGHVERDGTAHVCDCCECGEHHPYPDWPDEGVLCVAREPFYGAGTNFYGEDAAAESVGRWGQVIE